MNPYEIPKIGTTEARKAFWDDVLAHVLGSRKVAGKNITVDVHDGYGSVINSPQQGGSAATGACCQTDNWPSNTCSVTTRADCESGGGHFVGTATCEGVDCNTGACCEPFPSLCEDTFDFLCDTDCGPGEICWMGYGTKCETVRCEGACCCEGEACPGGSHCEGENITYNECHTACPPTFGCAVGWLLNGTCAGEGCSEFSPPP